MGKHNRPAETVAEVPDIGPVSTKLKKFKKDKTKSTSEDKSTSKPQLTPSLEVAKSDSKSSAKKRKRDKKDIGACDHDVSPGDETHHPGDGNPMNKTAPLTAGTKSASPSSQLPPAKKHKKHMKPKHGAPEEDEEITAAEMLLRDRAAAKKAEAEEQAERERAEKAARKARKAEKKERRRREAEGGEGSSKAAPDVGTETPEVEEGKDGKKEKREKSEKKKAKRSSSEIGAADVVASSSADRKSVV